VEFRRTQQEFIARGLASRDAARESGEYVSAKKVLSKLSAKLKKAQAKQSSK
jgi:hypothetical protein